MRKFVIAIAALAISAAPAHAQFEDFAGSEGFAGFSGNTGNAGCVSGASGSAMWGMGGTSCNSSATGDYSNTDYSVQAGTFDGDINGGFSETSGFNSSISSVWSMENGEDAKSGGNTIGIGSSNTSGAGVSYTGSTWGSFEQGSLSTFEGTSSVETSSWFLQGFGD